MPNERIKTAPPEKPREELLSDYFSLLAASENEKYELINQTLYKMAGRKFAHAQITQNLLFLLGNCLWESEFIVAGSDAGVCAPENAFFANFENQ